MRRGIGSAVVLAFFGLSASAFAANVYVSSFASGVVSQYSVAADGMLVALSPATVPSGTGSQAIVLSADRKSVYVANNSANTVAQFSVGADGTLSPKTPATVAVTRPVGAAVSPDGRSAYFTSQTSGVIAQFDIAADGTLSAKSPATVAALANQGDVVVNAASTRAYVGNTGGTLSQYAIAADGTLSALSPATVASGGNQSTGLGLSPDGTHLYVANRGGNSVSWMAVGSGDGTLSLAGTIAAQAQPNDVTLSPDGHSAYAANQNTLANSISQYTVAADGSLTSNSPAVIASPTTPKTVVFSTDGTNAYVPHQNSPDVGMFSVAGNGTLTAKSPATVASAAGAFAAVYSDGPPVTTSPPVAITGAASAITDTGATVAGTVDPNGVATNYTFEYGTSTSFGAISPVSSAGAGPDAVAQTADLTGLAANTTYYYRLAASSSAGDSVGTVHTFRTTGVAVAPAVVTQAATAVTTTSATLHGQVNPSGQQTVFTFEYGTTTAFGAITTVVALDDADALEPVSATLTGLAPDTTYYYRVVASNATGTTSGAVLRFSTGPGGLPAVTTGAATGVSASGATLAGTVDAHGAQTAFAFEYGTTTAFGSLSAIDNAGDGNAVQQITLPISGLQPGTTYLCRIIATNANGTTFGDVHSFTTTG